MTSEDKHVQYFNEVHKTTYTKAEIDGIYWLCDIHKLKTADAIGYAHKCHTCGQQIETIGNEFCSPDCKITNNIRHHFPEYVCYWGKECKICTQAYKTNGSNYADYELEGDEIEVDDGIPVGETFDVLEYSDEFEEDEDEEEPLLSLKNPRDDPLAKVPLERTSNYISSDEDDSLLCSRKNSDKIQSLIQGDNTNANPNVFQENIIEMMIRLYGQPNKGKQ
jgi:hypothetical protein